MLVVSMLVDERLEPSSGEQTRRGVLVFASSQHEPHEVDIVRNVGDEDGNSLIGLVSGDFLGIGRQFDERR